MSHTYISKALRERVAAQARRRCGYCLTSERIVGTPMPFNQQVRIKQEYWLLLQKIVK